MSWAGLTTKRWINSLISNFNLCLNLHHMVGKKKGETWRVNQNRYTTIISFNYFISLIFFTGSRFLKWILNIVLMIFWSLQVFFVLEKNKLMPHASIRSLKFSLNPIKDTWTYIYLFLPLAMWYLYNQIHCLLETSPS